MRLDIISPEKQLYSGDVDYVQLPGTTGSFGILENHAPIISTLAKGDVVLRETGKNDSTIAIKGGVVEVNNNRIIVLAE